MEWLAQQPKVMFVGQTVAGPGTFMFQTLRDCPKERCLEMPINESFQMQFTIGLALTGTIPVSVYPRQNFLLLATGDMVNVLDKIPLISGGKWPLKMIIRVATGPDAPVHPGHQHIGNYAKAFRELFHWIDVVELNRAEDIFPAYTHALARTDGKSFCSKSEANCSRCGDGSPLSAAGCSAACSTAGATGSASAG